LTVPGTDIQSQQQPGTLEVVAEFSEAMPTGVTVSHDGRIFVCFPRWGDPVDFTVAELVNGRAVAYPDHSFNQPQSDDPAAALISVQSVVVDPHNRLWFLDTGSIEHGPTTPGGPKLVGVDLATNQVVTTITFPPDIAFRHTYLNDLRFDLRRGAGGLGFITDSSRSGPNGIIVVELGSGRSWRRLHDHPSTKPVWGFLPFVEGQPHLHRPPGQPPSPVNTGVDGIAISADGHRLFYCPLASRRLYSVAVDALADPAVSDAQVAETVIEHGEKGASDGLESDDAGRIYVTNYEANAIFRRRVDGQYEVVVQDPRMLWPDTMSIATDGYLYVTANQLHRQPQYHGGQDRRQKPYYLFRTPLGVGPVLLR
jgi:sugar lactone lactonase YvrE